MSRVILGAHPQGPMGLFISKPGVDCGAVGPADPDNLLFSTEWSGVASIHAAGTVGLDTTVGFSDLGYVPLIRFEEILGGGAYAQSAFRSVIPYDSNSRNRIRIWTRYGMSQPTRNSLIIRKRDTQTDTFNSNPVFRYLVFTIPID